MTTSPSQGRHRRKRVHGDAMMIRHHHRNLVMHHWRHGAQEHAMRLIAVALFAQP